MKKLVLAALGAALVVGGYLTLTGFRGHGGCGHGGGPARMERMLGAHLDDLLDDVHATPEQRAKITAVKERLVAEGKALRGDHRTERKDLLAQWDSPNPDVNRIHAMIDQRGESMKGFAHKVADGLGEVHAVLTPEQRAQLSKKMQRRMGEE